jgi:hypothetical protein
MQKRFSTLRIISSLYKFAAILLAGFSLVGFAFALYVSVSRPADWYPTNVPNGYQWVLLTGGLGLFVGIFLALLIYGAGSLIDLLLAIEENTRMSAREARRMVIDARRRDLPPAPQPKTQPIRTPPRQTPRPSAPTSPPPIFDKPVPNPPSPDDDDMPDFGRR